MSISVDYVEMDGSPKESREYGKFAAQRQLKCAWDDRHTLMLEMLALPGEPYEPRPTTGAKAKTATCERFGKMTNTIVTDTVATYLEAIVTVNYATPEADDPTNSGGTIISESIEPTAEFLSLDHNLFRWGSPGGVALEREEAPGRLQVGFDYVFTKYSLATVPIAVLTMLGKSNVAAVTATLLGLTFAAETLLYNPPQISREVDAAGNGLFTLQYRFTYRPTGWNKYWNNQVQAYQDIYISGGAIFKQFPGGDFTQL